MTKRIRRDIGLIAEQLQVVMKREAADIIEIGDLLLEAKDQLEHGEWLPWLKTNFGPSTTTAENYMAAARFAAKIPNVVNLKLRPTALYLLGRELDDPSDFYSPKVIKAILKAAETEWVNTERAFEIARSLQPPEPPIEDREAEWIAAEEAERSEIDDILEGPPPDLPPAPEATVRDVILPPFDQAVGTLAQLQTKPLASFIATTYEPDRIRAVIIFLQEVADAIEKRKAAA
jgi:Protein of unknown function (DUF3102)